MIVPRPKALHFCLAISFLIIALIPRTASCTISNAAVLFLDINGSPRGIGMGGCSINLVTPEAPLNNPAALGLFHLDHVMSVSIPNSTQWLPRYVNYMHLKSWGASGGVSYRLLRPHDSLPFNVALGLAYSRAKMDYGESAITDPYGSVIDTYDSYDKADYFSGGLGLEFRAVRLGFGYSYKRIKSVLGYYGSGAEHGMGTATGNAHDYGYLAQIRLHELIPHKWYLGQSQKYFAHLELTPSYAYVKANVGDSMAYIQVNQKDRLPEGSHKGPAIYGAIDINQARLISVYWTTEIWKAVFAENELKPHGMEFGVGDIFFYRFGRYGQPDGDLTDSKGYGVSLGGLISWLDVFGQMGKDDSPAARWMRRLDVRFDYAKLSGANSPFDRTTYYKVTISLAW